MSVALRLYEQLTEAGEDKTRARAIADAFEQLEERYPNLKEVATQGHVRESELRLNLQIKEVEAKLEKEIREIEANLRIEIEKVRGEMKAMETRLTQAIHRQTLWVVGSVGGIIGGIRLLDWLLAHLTV